MLQVTYRNLPPTPAIEEAIQEKAARLGKFFPRIMSCRVAVEATSHRHMRGNVYRVRIDVTVPGAELVIGRDPSAPHAHDDVYVAIREAFDGIRRQLQDHARRQRGFVKSHEQPPHGRVARFFPQQRYGFIETADDREIYFHANSVLDGAFDRLEVGDEVRFTEEEGEEGPQASTVVLIGK
ncbi:MAG: ribosome-associated translation inhibitor RaiA [Polyangiaceae bacterium]|nr:ribosome-associated translation inhibitor RaiA [Polyangiaceae bacterium]